MLLDVYIYMCAVHVMVLYQLSSSSSSEQAGKIGNTTTDKKKPVKSTRRMLTVDWYLQSVRLFEHETSDQ